MLCKSNICSTFVGENGITMKYSVNSSKLFEGIEELVANVVLEDGVHILRLKSTEKTNLYEVVGNTAVKTDEPLLETQLLEGMTVRVDLEQAHQLIERYKEESRRAWDRSEVYKHKYEDSESEKECMQSEHEELIRAKDEEICAKNEELRAKDEEIRLKDIEIAKLRAQLEYANEHPQIVNYVQGNLNNNATDNRSQVAIKEMKVEAEGVGVQTCEMREKESNKDEIQRCKYIVVERAKDNTTYGLGCKPEDDQKRLDGYNRALLNAFEKGGQKLQILQQGEQLGYLDFYNDGITEVYEHFVEILGHQPYTLSAFYKACSKLNWRPKINVKPSYSKKFQ